MNDVIQSKNEGTEAIYPVNKEQAWTIAKQVFRWEGTETIEDHKEDDYMLTSSGGNFVSWGALMAAWIEPVDLNNTKVTVVTKRRYTLDYFTTLTETTFHHRFAQAVGMIKAGKKLPIAKPDD